MTKVCIKLVTGMAWYRMEWNQTNSNRSHSIRKSNTCPFNRYQWRPWRPVYVSNIDLLLVIDAQVALNFNLPVGLHWTYTRERVRKGLNVCAIANKNQKIKINANELMNINYRSNFFFSILLFSRHRHPHGRFASCILSHCGVAIFLSFVMSPILCLPTYFVFRINERIIHSDKINQTKTIYHVNTKEDTMLYRYK